jgi:hypothetical protein
MRSIKMFGLAAVAAVAAMAFMGATSAMATFDTTLCDQDPAGGVLTCPAGNLVSHVHFETVAKGAILKTTKPALTLTCTSLFLGDVLTAGLLAVAPNPLLISGVLSYSACNNGCEIKDVSKKIGHLDLLKEAEELAKVEGLNFEILLKCGEVIHCIYGAAGVTGHALGALKAPPNGHVNITEKTVTKVGGTLCPEKAVLTALYAPLVPLYIKS